MLLSRTTTSLSSLPFLYLQTLISPPLTQCFSTPHILSWFLHKTKTLRDTLSLSLSCSASPRTRAWIVYLLSAFSYFSPVSFLQVKTLTCFHIPGKEQKENAGEQAHCLAFSRGENKNSLLPLSSLLFLLCFCSTFLQTRDQ